MSVYLPIAIGIEVRIPRLQAGEVQLITHQVRLLHLRSPVSKLPSTPYPLTLEITDAGFPKRSWVKISQIRVLAIERISTKIGQVSSAQLTQLIVGLNEIIGDDLASSQDENG